MSRLVSRAELAALAKVSKAAITKACGARLAPACEGARVDIDHPAVIRYLADKGVGVPPPVESAPEAQHSDRAPTGKRKRAGRAPAAPTRPTPPDVAEVEPTDGAPTGADAGGPVRIVSREVTDVSAIADMTIREVVAKWGTVTAFKDWLQSLRLIADVHAANIKNAQTDGRLISRDLVETRMVSAVEASNRRLLTDAPKTIARELYAYAHAAVALEEGEKLVQRVIGSHLRSASDSMAKALRTS